MQERNNKPILHVGLKYNEERQGVIREMNLLSKSSLRRYTKCDKIPRIKNGYATVIISTSKGLMTGVEAKAKRIGGEPICYVF